MSRPPQAIDRGTAGSVRQQHAEDQADDHRHHGVNDQGHHQQRSVKLLQLGDGHTPHPGENDAGQEVDRIPEAVAA